MTAIATVQLHWDIPFIVARAGGVMSAAHLEDNRLFVADVDEDALAQAVAAYDDGAHKLNTQWAVVRSDRDARLAACDWTQVADSPLDEVTQAAWATYRQELRDVPADNSDPYNIAWPVAP